MIKYHVVSAIVFTAIAISCGMQNDVVTLVENKDITPQDSLDEMLKLIAMVDSQNVVETISDKYVEMKVQNEELQEELEETKEELIQTVQHLEKAQEIIATHSYTDTIKSEFKLLPISKADNN